MLVMVDMKNVVLRGETYFFRMRVPHDCVEQVGYRGRSFYFPYSNLTSIL
jgi:hypothetical protein